MKSNNQEEAELSLYKTWLEEFSESENAANFTDFQNENIEEMAHHLITFSQNEKIALSLWTGKIVVDLLVNTICKSVVQTTMFYDNYPETMATFFQFLGEKKYLPNGAEVAQSLLAAKRDIKQTEEEAKKIRMIHKILEEAISEGIDPKDMDAVKVFIDNKARTAKLVREFRDKLDAGIPVPIAMESLSQEERDIIYKDLAKETATEFDPVKAKRGIKLLEAAVAKGMSVEEASATIPEDLMSDTLGMMGSMMKDKPAYNAPVKPIISGSKIGRNAPCPCGSGKKYKRCCIHKR